MWKRRQKGVSATSANAPVTPATEWQLPISEHSGTRTPSIYEFLVALLQSDGSYGKNPPELPDERRDPTSIGWSAGALDGIPIARESDVDNAETIADAISDLAAQSTEGRSRHLYSLVAHAEVLHVVDDVLQRIIDRRLDRRRVEAIGRWLATGSLDRSAVKVGIAMLGIAKSSETDVLLTLGAHDEFTLFVAVALRNSGASERVLFELAKRVHGWGRVQSVERLGGSTDPEIRRWMLVEGYQNGVMYEYLAMTCATTGGLALALTEESIDDQLLAGAGDIIAALIAGGPGPSIGAYEDANRAVERYLTHVSKRRGSLTQRRIVSTIRDALAEGDELTMDDVEKDRMLAVADEFLGRSHFTEDVTTALLDPDGQTFWDARSAARDLGIDIFDAVYRRIETHVDEHPLWSFLLESATPERLSRCLALGRQQIDFSAIATGPSMAIGVGAEFRQHMELGWFLQALRAFPGQGWDFVDSGLRSASVQNRNGALRALQGWQRANWPPNAESALTSVIAAEVHPKVKQFATDVLNGDVPTREAWRRTIATLRERQPELADLAQSVSEIDHVARLRSESNGFGVFVIWDGPYDSVGWETDRVSVGRDKTGFHVSIAPGRGDTTERFENLSIEEATTRTSELTLPLSDST